MSKAKKYRKLVKSASKKVTKANVSWSHCKEFTLHLLPLLEECEETNDINKIKKAYRTTQQFKKVVHYLEERLKHEIDNLEYLKKSNREKQKRLSESQLRALFKNQAIRNLEKGSIPYTDENLKIELDDMIKAYIEREGERYEENKEVKKEILKRVNNFNPEGLDFDINKPM